jgi:hypothetical protein
VLTEINPAGALPAAVAVYMFLFLALLLAENP